MAALVSSFFGTAGAAAPGTMTCTVTSNAVSYTPGNTMLVGAQNYWDSGTGVVGSAASTGDTWTPFYTSQLASAGGVFQWFLAPIKTAGTRSVVLSWTTTGGVGSFGMLAVIMEFQGAYVYDPATGGVGTAAFQTDSGPSTSWTGPAITPSGAGDIIVVQAQGDNGQGGTPAPSTGFTNITTVGPSNPFAYGLFATGGSKQLTWTGMTSDTYSSAAFALSALPPPQTPRLIVPTMRASVY